MADFCRWKATGFGVALMAAVLVGCGPNKVGLDGSNGIVENGAKGAYPAPEISIVARAEPSEDLALLSRSSSLYGDSYSYSRHHSRHRSSRKKAKVVASDTKEFPKDADPNMGFIAADDKKLKDAMERANRAERDAARQWQAAGPNGR